MKNSKISRSLIFLMISSLLMIGCSDDDDITQPPQGPNPTGNSKTFTLGSVSDPAISGTATFIENDDNSVTVTIDLSNTTAGNQHPAHIHLNTAAQGGGIAVSLDPIDGDTGESSTTFSQLDNGTAISYNQLLDFDGYINVHLSETDLATLVAQGDIGQNELTGASKSYVLGAVAIAEISGTAIFYERQNGEALAVINLQNTPAGGSHPGHIHFNTAVEGGGIAFSFNPVDGDSGISRTNVAALDDNTPFGYDEVLGFNGYINIHLSTTELSTLVAQGDIGQNELTGTTKSYDLLEKDVAGISGTVEFAERSNGTTLATISLSGTPAGGEHPAHIHENDAATGGGILFSFNPVNGDTGISKTQIAQLDDDSPVSYTDLLTIDGYINVHLSAAELSTIVAQGNIGINEGASTTTTNYDVTNSGASAYVFNDSGFTNTSNPDLTLERGKTYTFTVNSPGHPFFIKSAQTTGTGDQYNDGVTNNGASQGTVTFTVPQDAPNTLFYICEFHSPMTGTITIID